MIPWTLVIFVKRNYNIARKMPKYAVFSGLHFPTFKLNMEICSVNLHTQSKYRNIRTTQEVVGYIPCGVATW